MDDMNPILAAALGSILRHLLTSAAAILVARGYWTPEDATTYVVAAAAGLLGLGWAVYHKYRANLTILDALAMPKGSTVAQLQKMQAGQ